MKSDEARRVELIEKIKNDPELWAEIHLAAIRTIDELRVMLKVKGS